MRRLRTRSPTLLITGGPIVFPDPEDVDDEGLLAVGGDLSPERLLAAYEQGIFPWYDDGVPPLWWSPNPRMVIEKGAVHVSRSLRRVLTHGRFEVTWNRTFERVMRGLDVLRRNAVDFNILTTVHAANEHRGREVLTGVVSARTAGHS